MTTFTVLGSSGFIGSRLVSRLRADGATVSTPSRDGRLAGRDLGHVIYCIGVTADFRSRLLETVEAHVCRLVAVLQEASFESLTYLSSTRVYQAPVARACEDDALVVRPVDVDHLYNISKILGEATVLSDAGPSARVVRLSNVYGLDPASENFLTSVIGTALRDRHVELGRSLESAKDYVSLDDVVELIPAIATSGRDRIYNVAAGSNVTNGEIADVVSAACGCTFSVAPGAPTIVSSVIDVERISNEFGFRPKRLIDDLPELIARYAEGL